jgi:hypothetical protein
LSLWGRRGLVAAWPLYRLVILLIILFVNIIVFVLLRGRGLAC